MTTTTKPAADVLVAAGRQAGIDVTDATLIRDGSNVLYRINNHAVARIGRAGTQHIADREVRVSQWLAKAGMSVIQMLPGVPQPTIVNDRPVTWWAQLPQHRPATPAELAEVLRQLHDLPIPTDPQLPHIDPFTGLSERIAEAPRIGADQAWLADHLTELQSRYGQLRFAQPQRVIHGDAWQDNVAVSESGEPILLDLEKVSIGHVEWDLIQIAVDWTDFARLTEDEYRSFVTNYGGYDVTHSPAYRVLADIQELRWVCFVLSKAGHSRNAADETHHRIACLKGDIRRPWKWNPF